MQGENGASVRGVVWSEICPWLVLLKVFRLAMGARVLLLATIGLMLTVVVWGLLAAIFSPNPHSQAVGCTNRYLEKNLSVVTEMVPRRPGLPALIAVGEEGTNLRPRAVATPIVNVWIQLTRPMWSVLDEGISFGRALYLLVFGLCSLAIWSFFGGAITRIASVELTCGEHVPLGAALRFACARFLAYFTAPLVPIVAILVVAIPVFLLGLLLNFSFGVFLASLAWPVALLCGFVMALFLVGLVFGWPLMWATISTEGTDSFDALQRSYAYVFQRPLRYLFYALVAAVLGGLGWLLVWNFAALIVQLTDWVAAWVCSAQQFAAMQPGAEQPLTGFGWAGSVVIDFWEGCIRFVAAGFLYTYFWCAASAIYLLMRRDVDATEMDEIFLEEDADEAAYGLPGIGADAEGAPVVEEAAAENGTADAGAEAAQAPESPPAPDAPKTEASGDQKPDEKT